MKELMYKRKINLNVIKDRLKNELYQLKPEEILIENITYDENEITLELKIITP